MCPKKGFWVLLLMVALGSSEVWADSSKEGKGVYEKTREKIQMIKMLKLTESLKMDRDQSARFFAVDSQYEEAKRRFHREIHEDIQKLRNLIRDTNPPDRELRDIVARIKNRKRDIDELMNKQTEEELNLLKPEQQARYLLFQIDFRREMDNLIREIREGRSSRPGVEAPAEKIK